MKQYIENNIKIIMEVMLDFYVKEYINQGKKFIESNKLGDIFKIANIEFKEIEKKVKLIKEKINKEHNNEITSFLPDNVFYFFTLLKSSMPKFIGKHRVWVTANNVYFARETFENLYLKDDSKKIEGTLEKNQNKLKEHVKNFFYDKKHSSLTNYIGTMHIIEILIRSMFFFEFSYKLKTKEKELMLNYFTWMVINSYKNLYQNKNGYWKAGYYFRELLKFLFFDGKEMILPYDKNKSDSKNIKKTIKEIYKNTMNKIYLLMSSDLMGIARNDIVFPNNLQ